MKARSLRADFSLSALVAGFVAVLVGYTSSVAIVFQAAQALGASAAQTASWMWALGLGMGLTCIALSWRWRLPVLTAWSTPGAALIAASQGLDMAEGVGAFMVCAALTSLAGLSRLFERLMDRLPLALAGALLAGVLARFCLDAVLALRSAPLLVLAMAAAYLLGRRCWPRYAVPGVLLVGMALAGWQGQLHWQALPGLQQLPFGLTLPVWTSPRFTLAATIGLALPLFIVTMASQNLPGVAAQRAAGFAVPISPVVTATGLTTLLLAPFGAFAVNLAAITAAICMGPEATPTRPGAGSRRSPPVCSTPCSGWSVAPSPGCWRHCRASWWWRWPGWRCWAPSPPRWPPPLPNRATATPPP